MKQRWAYIKTLGIAVLAILFFACMPGSAQATSDLIGYWNFDETSGATMADSSANSNNGTIQGSGVTHSTVVPPTNCFLNPRSLSFDGSGGYVSIADNASMDPANQISIAFWMNPSNVSNGYQHIVFKQGPVVTSYGVWLNGDHVYMEDNDNSVRSLTSNAALSVGQWHYIAVTYDGTTQKLYIDGALDNSQSLPGITLTYQNSPVKIGAGDYNNPFSGKIDDLRIYNRALSDNEVTDLATGGCGPGVVSNNGLASGVEDGAPNSGDGNNDGIADSQQANVASFLNQVTTTYATVVVPISCTLSALSTTNSSSLATSDGNYSYPLGLMNYTADCGTPGYAATIDLYYHGQTATSSVLRKYNATTHTYTAITGYTITPTTIGGQVATKVTYQATDGGPLDSDGLANGIIVDPVGLALAPAATASSQSPKAPNTGYATRQTSSIATLLGSAILGMLLIGILGLQTQAHRHDTASDSIRRLRR